MDARAFAEIWENVLNLKSAAKKVITDIKRKNVQERSYQVDAYQSFHCRGRRGIFDHIICKIYLI